MKKEISEIIPLGKFILVKKDEPEDNADQYGLVTPSNVEKEQKASGNVVLVGSDVKAKIKVGDNVLYAKYTGGDDIEVKQGKIQGKYIILHEDDIYAVIKYKNVTK